MIKAAAAVVESTFYNHFYERVRACVCVCVEGGLGRSKWGVCAMFTICEKLAKSATFQTIVAFLFYERAVKNI